MLQNDDNVEEIPDYTNQDVVGLLIEAYREIENFNDANDLAEKRSIKAQSIIDLVEAMCGVETKTTEINTLLREKLLQIVDAIAMEFGGSVFLAPLDIVANSSLGSKKKSKKKENLSDLSFLDYVWSTSSKDVLREMENQSLKEPSLSRASMFQLILLSKRFKLLEGSNVKVPDGHFKLKSVLIVPVVVNKQSVALLGMANGTYTKNDGDILMEILPKIWSNIILESISKASKQIESIERLRRVEERVENIKKLSRKLSQFMSSNEEEESGNDADLAKIKLRSIVNFCEEEYGGIGFIGPLKVESNLKAFKSQNLDGSSQSSSGSEVDDDKADRYEFLQYIFSKSAEEIRRTIMKNFKKPILQKAKTMLEVVKSRKVLYLKNCSNLNLPEGHFPMSNVLLIPISVNQECVALVGLTNGNFDEFTGDILNDVLASSWYTLIQDIYSKIKLTSTDKYGKKRRREKIELSSIIAMKILDSSALTSQKIFPVLYEFLHTRFCEITNGCIINKVIVMNDTFIAVTNKVLIKEDSFAKAAIAMRDEIPGEVVGKFGNITGLKIGIGLSKADSLLITPFHDQLSIFGNGIDQVIQLASKSEGIHTNSSIFEILQDKYDFETTEDSKYVLKSKK
eukprot:gene9644-1848_t